LDTVQYLEKMNYVYDIIILLLGPPLFLSVTRARLNFVNRKQ